MTIRNFAQSIAPPILWDLGRRARNRINKQPAGGYHGVYSSFAEMDLQLSAGFVDQEGLKWAVDKAQLQSVDPGLYPDTVRLTLLVNLLTEAGESVTVVDYGGGTGNTFVSVLPTITRPDSVSWTIVELPEVAAAAQRFLGGRARVSEDIAEALEQAQGKVILLARGAVQYLPEPFELLSTFTQLQPDYIVLSRVPAGNAPSFACVQYFHAKTPQPMWFLQADAIQEALESKAYVTVNHWEEPATRFDMDNYPVQQRIACASGWLFKKRKPPVAM